MSQRPFIKLGISALEELFSDDRDNERVLRELVNELNHRKTNRAVALKERVEAALDLGHTNNVDNSGELRSKRVPQPKNIGEEKGGAAPTRFSGPKVIPFERAYTDISGLSNPERVLLSWTALEVLSPQSFKKPEDLVSGDRYKIAKIERGDLPWENGGEKSRKNYRLFYQVVLGSIQMPSSIESLLKTYTDTTVERFSASGESIIATVLVDQYGRPVEQDPCSVSSFAWGLPIALEGDLKALGAWSSVERSLKGALENHITRYDEYEEVQPLRRQDIEQAYEWLRNSLGLSEQLCTKPKFAVRTYQYFRSSSPPDTLLLNSFFLSDLAKAQKDIANGKAPLNLRRYLADILPENRKELLTDELALSDALHPGRMPSGAWPGSGRFSLVTLQQAAVNLAASDLKKDGMLAVNGPPGTGKTTLLRDVVANVVTDRAIAMAAFDDPEDAFVSSDERLKRGQAFLQLYKLDERLRGFEMVVASSNNKAVENVSAELPSVSSVAEDAFNDGYFKTCSDALLESETWGLVAAVLGNGKNRAHFRQKFWWDPDSGMMCYLKHCAGGRSSVIYTDEKGAEHERPPKIVTNERPPSNKFEALKRWQDAKEKFFVAKRKADNALSQLSRIADSVVKIPELKVLISSIEARRELVSSKLQVAQEKQSRSQTVVEALCENELITQRMYHAVLNAKLGIFRRVFSRRKYKAWRIEFAHAESKLLESVEAHDQGREQHSKLEEHVRVLQQEQTKLENQSSKASKTLSKMLKELQEHKARHGGITIDGSFFENSHERRQLSAPWLDSETSLIRQNLFDAAMTLHRAFIDAAAKPLKHNLGILLDNYGTSSLGTPERDALIPHLWSSLFLIVPVVSTAFASVARMFSGLEKDSLGWLLIDEAGQALPQAAVGAIMRSRRAVVVGDPMQIEPVVTLPEQLTEAICREFSVDETVYNAPACSAQTLADSATAYYAAFETQHGSREVGVPLLVHRRCADPMFGISNRVAYEGLMVHAKGTSNSKIQNVIGESRWIDVKSAGEDKWCAREGDVVLKILRKLREASVRPDVYIVTPFVIVQNRLREVIRDSGLLDGWVENPRWIYDRIGTVHTVQGRESEAVIFVLGAPDPEQTGARNWAGGRPNLLNVAVSRSKEALYVIGNRALWEKSGVFSILSSSLRRRGNS